MVTKLHRSIPFLSYLFISLALLSCASGGGKERLKLRELARSSQFSEAIKELESSEVYEDNDNKLLLLMEKGLLLHAGGNYYQSSEVLEQAKDLGRKLYTTSVSNKVQKLIANDNYDIYYGERYEISLIHFYQALNHLLISKQGFYEAFSVREGKDGIRQISRRELTAQEIKKREYSARAEVLAWDSFLKNLKSERQGKSVFKNDLLAKVFGAYIHEFIGSKSDLEIALQLYKDGHKLIIKNYGAYKSLNSSYRKYNQSYKTFPKLGPKRVEEKFISETKYLVGLKTFLNERIVDLTLQIRGASLSKVKRQFNISAELIKKVKSNRHPNVTVIFQKGMIPLKTAKQEYFGLGGAINDPKAGVAAKIGAAVLTVFAANKLGLLPPPRSYSPAGTYLGLSVAEVAVSSAAIRFELPKIINPGIHSKNEIIIKDSSGAAVFTKSLSLIAPLGDISEQAVAEEAASLYTRLGSRLALKHVTAIAAAFGTYKMLSNNSDTDFFAKQAAVFQYIASAKAIEASESADTRYWSTLPSDIWIGRFKLKAGSYQAFIRVKESGKTREIKLGPLEVKKGLSNFINFRTTN